MTISSLLIQGIPTITLDMPSTLGPVELKMPGRLNEDEFFTFCTANPDLQIEQDKHGKIIIMAPVGFDSGYYEGEAFGELRNWNRLNGMGRTFSPSTGFKLPDGSTHSADAAWISNEKIAKLTPDQRKRFAPIVPDFVIEVRSESDGITRLKRKMASVWIKNGVNLAWLIDPVKQNAYIYRQDGIVETIADFENVLSGEDVCEGFEFDLRMLRS